MPDYLPPSTGVSFSRAYAEACVTADVRVVLLDTLSLEHSAIGSGTALRYVCDHADLTATLEADAVVQPGESVTFGRASFAVELPPVADSESSPSLRVTVPGISAAAAQAVREAAQTSEPLYITHRVYASTDNSGPAVLPVTRMQVVSVPSITEDALVLEARVADPGNRAYPSYRYTRAEHPGLSA